MGVYPELAKYFPASLAVKLHLGPHIDLEKLRILFIISSLILRSSEKAEDRAGKSWHREVPEQGEATIREPKFLYFFSK